MFAMKRVLLVATLLGALGCNKGPSEGQCQQLLDHLIDLEFKKAGTSASSDEVKAELAKQKDAVRAAKSSEFIATCKDKTARTRVECALKATTLEAVAACDSQK